jgi:hypothetical protein
LRRLDTHAAEPADAERRAKELARVERDKLAGAST